MLNNNELLLLALGLAMLGYNLGALLLMMPLPFPGLKRWGPTLMRDAVYSAILIGSAHIILNIVPYLQKLLGVSWTHFTLWITGRIGWLAGWKTALSALMAAASKVLGGFFVYTVLEPLSKMINYALTTMYSILSVSIIVKACYAKLIILGILLFSVPFRLTRAVGSYLIAFAIVFMVGLPFMPAFINEFTHAQITPPPSGGCEFGAIEVKTAVGYPIAYPVVEGRDGNGKLLFRYLGNREGIVSAGFPDRGLPKNQSFYAELSYLGTTTPLEPRPVVPKRDYEIVSEHQTEWRVKLELTAPLIIAQPLPLTAVVRSEGVEITSLKLGELPLIVEARSLYKEGFIEFRYLSIDNATVIVRGSETSVVNGTWKWMGLEGRYVRVMLPEGEEVTIVIDVKREGSLQSPQVEEISYLEVIGLSPWLDFNKMAANILLSWVVLPAVYLFILGAISSALAYVIGGSKSKVPLKLW